MSESRIQFSPKQIAASLQVSESSVKRWCDQGAIPTVRTVGGHRRITLGGLREFLLSSERTLVDPIALGVDPSEVMPPVTSRPAAGESTANAGLPSPRQVEPSTPSRLSNRPPNGQCQKSGQSQKSQPRGQRKMPLVSREQTQAIQDHFVAALIAGDEQECHQILQHCVTEGWKRWEAAETLIATAMRQLGEAWDCGKIDVYEERRSCNICARLIYSLREQLSPPGDDAPIAVGAAPESDPYQLPTTLVELALRETGWHAINLGNDIPLDSMIKAAQDYQPKLVWLSVSAVRSTDQFVREQNLLADSLPKDVSLIVGGKALDEVLRPRLRYTAHCDSLRNLIELAEILKR